MWPIKGWDYRHRVSQGTEGKQGRVLCLHVWHTYLYPPPNPLPQVRQTRFKVYTILLITVSKLDVPFPAVSEDRPVVSASRPTLPIVTLTVRELSWLPDTLTYLFLGQIIPLRITLTWEHEPWVRMFLSLTGWSWSMGSAQRESTIVSDCLPLLVADLSWRIQWSHYLGSLCPYLCGEPRYSQA